MSCGIPVLATAVGGVPEIVEHGRTRWLLERPSVEKLVLDLKGIWLHREALAPIGRAGRESVLTRFYPKSYMNELDALYNNKLKVFNLK
jgi:glycosyltransferase involved in cell wall biosynthesis